MNYIITEDPVKILEEWIHIQLLPSSNLQQADHPHSVSTARFSTKVSFYILFITASRPTMKDLISMKRKDGSDKNLKIINKITAHDSSQCDDFGHMLLDDRSVVKKLRKDHKDDDDKFIRTVLEKWLSRDDDDKKGSLPCTWEAPRPVCTRGWP